MYDQITWIFVCAIILSFFVAFGIGANDVANAFGSSVGAKALTMKQAIVVAAICEFAGAVLMGAGVTTTIRSGIANLNYYINKPDVLAYGMLCAMLATGIWLLIATYWELPVSTTHSIVGAIVGMTMVSAGPDAVIWSKHKDTFPFLGGMSSIILSWVFSPVIAGGFAIILFFFIRLIVLRSQKAYERSLYLLPLFTFGTFFLITWFIITKGGQQYNWQNTPDSKKAWISAIVGSGTCLISIVIGIPLIKRNVTRDLAEEERVAADKAGLGKTVSVEKVEEGRESSEGEAGKSSEDGGNGSHQDQVPHEEKRTPNRLQTFRKSRVWTAMMYGSNVDIHKVVESDQTVHDIHEAAEVFDHKAETSFKYLQVCTACANSFAHGTNDVANSIGPLAAIYQIWQDTAVQKNAEVPRWILVVGGAGIVFGLATYGYKIMRALGVRLTKLTNSRGFTVELCAAAVVILGSRYDLPLSTTHSMVGAVTGIGILEGRRGFNWKLLLKFFLGWVATLVVAAITAAAFTAQGIYAPSRYAADQRTSTGWYLNGTSVQIARFLNATGVATGNQTLVQQAGAIMASAGQNTVPIVDLYPPTQTQGMALSYLGNNTLSCYLS